MVEREVENYLESILKSKGWVDDVRDPNRNVYRRSPRTDEEKELLKKPDGQTLFPDYILYSSEKTKYPIAIIEVKRPKHKDLMEAKDQGMDYATRLHAPYLFLFNKNTCKAIYVPKDKFLIRDKEEVEEILSLEELLKFNENVLVEKKSSIKTRSDLINIFDKVNNKLREAGITIGIQRFTEFSNLLFLKLVSDLNYEMKYNLPSKILWDTYKSMKGETLLAYINDTVIPELNREFKANQDSEGLFTKLKLRDTLILESILEIIDSLDLSDVDLDIKGDAFEYFIQKYNHKNNDLGEYFTPRHIVRFLVSVLNPKMFEKIYDPFCGTGGMLITTFKYLFAQLKREGTLNESSLDVLRNNMLYGSEKSETAKIAKMNMILTGDGHSNIKQQDTFINPVSNKYDVIITNIPFNLEVTSTQKAAYSLDINSGNATAIQHVLKALKENSSSARAVIIIPEGVLTNSIYLDLREKLVKEKYLDGIISFPPNVFLPYTESKTSVLLISGKAAPKSSKIFFYRVKNDGFTLTTRRRPIRGINDLDEFISISQLIFGGFDYDEIKNKNFISVSRTDVLVNKNKSLQSVHYHDEDKDNFIRLSKVLRRNTVKNVLQHPTATINNSSFWGVDLGEKYWGDNFISVTSDTNVNYSVLDEKEICFNPSRANVGSFGINMSGYKVSVSSAYPVYKVFNNDYLPEYIYLQLMHNPEVKEDIITRCFGTVRQSLGVDDFLKIQVPVLNLTSQKEIVSQTVERINLINESRADLANHLEKTYGFIDE